METPSREQLIAARDAIRQCAQWAAEVAYCATAPEESFSVSPAAQQLMDRLTWNDEEPEPYDPRASSLVRAVGELCTALEAARLMALVVDVFYTARSSGEVRVQGLIRANAHRLAWDYAHRVWLGPWNIYCGDLVVSTGKLPPADWSFAIPEQWLQEHVEEVTRKLATLDPADGRRLNALVKIEAARALAEPPDNRRADEDGEVNERSRSRASIPTVETRMMEVFCKNTACVSWTAKIWAQHLGCSEGAVKGTQTWKRCVMAEREKGKAERAAKSEGGGASGVRWNGKRLRRGEK